MEKTDVTCEKHGDYKGPECPLCRTERVTEMDLPVAKERKPNCGLKR